MILWDCTVQMDFISFWFFHLIWKEVIFCIDHQFWFKPRIKRKTQCLKQDILCLDFKECISWFSHELWVLFALVEKLWIQTEVWCWFLIMCISITSHESCCLIDLVDTVDCPHVHSESNDSEDQCEKLNDSEHILKVKNQKQKRMWSQFVRLLQDNFWLGHLSLVFLRTLVFSEKECAFSLMSEPVMHYAYVYW